MRNVGSVSTQPVRSNVRTRQHNKITRKMSSNEDILLNYSFKCRCSSIDIMQSKTVSVD